MCSCKKKRATAQLSFAPATTVQMQIKDNIPLPMVLPGAFNGKDVLLTTEKVWRANTVVIRLDEQKRASVSSKLAEQIRHHSPAVMGQA